MKKNLFKSVFITFLSFALIANVFTSCKSDEPTQDPADKTALTTLITESEALANAATTDDYPQTAIDAFKSIINTAKTALQNESITQSAVDNLVVQLTEARKTFLASAYDAIPETALLIGLSFDEGEGTELTAAGKGLKAKLEKGPSEIFGTNTNLPSFINGKKGKAMYFSNGSHLAINDYAANDFLGKELSIAVWVKPDSTRAGNYIISNNYWKSWKFQLQEQNKLFFTLSTTVGVADADNESDFSAPNNEWTHVAVSLNLSTEKLSFYVNGTLTKEWTKETKPNLTGSVTSYDKTLPILIGACTTYAEAKTWDWAWNEVPASWDSFIGAMDELKVYNVSLTEGQVRKLYNDENK